MLENSQIIENDQEYDLKKSTTKVGQLYPILKANDGEILDGVHRMEADPTWKTLTLENINTPEEKLTARLVANFHRRTVSSEEKASWINQLAAIYRENGLKIEGARKGNLGHNEIVDRICEATGLNWRTVHRYLDPQFKNQNMIRADASQHPAVKSPEEVIFNHLKHSNSDSNPNWAKDVIDRFKQEHEAELLASPLFRRKILNSIPRNLSQPMRPAIAFDPQKDEQVQELLRLKEEDVFRDNSFQTMMDTRGRPRESQRHRVARENQEGYEPLPNLYKTFMQECPKCLCSNCQHAKDCLERVRPDD